MEPSWTKGWETESKLPVRSAKQVLSFEDWWPGIVLVHPVAKGGYKPWYGWDDIYYEDDNLRQRFEREMNQILDELDDLAEEEMEELAEEEQERKAKTRRIIIPEVLPRDWRKDEQQGETRHVHYNFASDLDFGIRRRIIGILDRAEHRGCQIYGSEAFRTRENALVKGRFVGQGTHAWVLTLDTKERLAIAREAMSEGFKLVSFDDTSLSFIHLPSFPWKPVLLGAGAGAGLMGAGLFTGWLIWGRHPKN